MTLLANRPRSTSLGINPSYIINWIAGSLLCCTHAAHTHCHPHLDNPLHAQTNTLRHTRRQLAIILICKQNEIIQSCNSVIACSSSVEFQLWHQLLKQKKKYLEKLSFLHLIMSTFGNERGSCSIHYNTSILYYL